MARQKKDRILRGEGEDGRPTAETGKKSSTKLKGSQLNDSRKNYNILNSYKDDIEKLPDELKSAINAAKRIFYDNM